MNLNSLKILLVEDNPGDARLIREMLAEAGVVDFEIEWVPRLSDGLEKLRRGEIDLVLLDLGLPDSRGLNTFVQAYAQAPQIPFVVLTGLDDETLALTAVREGAQDYLVKGQTDGSILLRAIRYATERKKIEEELRRANEALRREIEERRAAEMAVDAERQRLFALLDGLPANVYVKTPNYSLRFANRRFREQFGDWEGQNCYTAIYGRKEPCEHCTQLRVLETGGQSVKEATSADGQRTYQVHSYPFADVDGSPLVLTLGIDITQRKRAEEAVQQQLAFQQVLIDTLPMPIFYKDAQGVYLGCNKAFENFWGLSRKEIVGKSVFDISPQEIAVVYHEKDKELLEYPGTQLYEFIAKDKDGRLRNTIIYKATFLDHAGSVAGIVGGLLDITERKQAEEALKQSEQKYCQLVKTIPAVVFEGYADWSINFYDDKVEELTGYRKEDFNSRRLKWSALILPEDLEDAKHAFLKGLKNDGSYIREYRIRTKEGRILWLQCLGQISCTADGQIDHVNGVFYDISDRKAAEEALLESRERFRATFEQAAVGIAHADLELKWIRVNQKLCDILGYSREELLGQSLGDLTHPDDLKADLENVNKLLAGELPYFQMEKRYIRKDGSIFWANLTVSLISPPDGAPKYFIGVIEDINVRKQVEEEIRASEDRFRELFQNMSNGVAVYEAVEGGRDFIFKDFNRSAEWLDQVHRDQVIGHSVQELFPGVKGFGLLDVLKRVWRTGKPEYFPAAFYRDERISGWRENYVYKLPSGEVVAIFDDVTERKEAEEALRQSEARLAEAQRLARLGHWQEDLVSGEIHWSDEVYRIFGLDQEKFNPSWESPTKYIHPEDVERVKNRLAEARAGVKPYNLVARVIRPNGAVRYIHAQAEVVFDESGKPRRLLGTAQDVTERRIAEIRLRESEARFRAIFEAAAMGLALTDMQGRYLTANKTLQEMFGYEDAELRGKNFKEITHPDDLAKSIDLFKELVSGRTDHYQIEKRFHRQDGQYFWARVTVSAVRGDEGQLLYAIGMAEDITEAKGAEKKLQASEANLRHLTSQLLTAQEDERLRISRELHDELGQSLLVLKLQARSIERGLRAEEQQLREECDELLTNLDQLVDKVRRLSRDLSPTILEDLGLSAALRRLLRDFGKHYPIELEADHIEGIDHFFTAEAQLAIYRIFQESLTNIGKHSQATKLKINVDQTDDHISFQIQDNGKGFSPSQGRRLTPGMGLAAMEERARMVGGVLTVWSQEGSGTKISLDIPYSPQTR